MKTAIIILMYTALAFTEAALAAIVGQTMPKHLKDIDAERIAVLCMLVAMMAEIAFVILSFPKELITQ